MAEALKRTEPRRIGPAQRTIESMRYKRCAFALALTGILFAQPAPEPRVYDRVFLIESSTGRMTPLPYERVRQGGPSSRRVAWIEGGRSTLRIREGEDPLLAVAYQSGAVPDWVARLYLLQAEGGRRSVTLGVWAVSQGEAARDGAVPLRLEKYGKLSRRLILPPSLPPGEYAVSNPSGSHAFTFGIDPRAAGAGSDH